MGAQTLTVSHYSATYNRLLKDGTFVKVFSQVQLSTLCCIKLFAGFLSLVDMKGKSIYMYVYKSFVWL